ncbi:alpha/beta hydrolase [Flagellimonas lutimaris]|uniref:Alpha/beta hydrolase n=1 Tax=Flagellimonas lutimaris TaxID=475082 RepID=A0A3A1N537_9FLAO|nr:alpha/beta fold hydrolase [Allomuricauda lutimaris]RIV31651.1 alpha/beta hydrolase [Allomuricauda lutimaris]
MINSKKTIVLVHGAWEGAWSWGETIPFLEAEGHKVIAFDLPGHGDNEKPISEISLQLYADSVRKELDSIAEPVILVGHSFAGYIISQVAEDSKKFIEKLVFVASAIPYDNKPAVQIFKEDTESELLANMIFSEDESYATLGREAIKDVIMTGATDEQVDYALPKFVKQATKPFFEIVKTAKNFREVPKAYVETTKDRVISLAAQRKVQKETGINEVVTLEDGHVPLVTGPENLGKALNQIATS